MLMDLDILKRLIGLVRLSILNRMHNPQPCNRPPKNRVHLIQPRRSRRRDKIKTGTHSSRVQRSPQSLHSAYRMSNCH